MAAALIVPVSLLLALVAHEAGHVAVARLLGVRLTGVAFGRRGFGVRLGRPEIILSRRARALIAAGGPVASLLVMLTGPAALPLLVLGSLALLLVNLIPSGHSDGGKIWREVRGV